MYFSYHMEMRKMPGINGEVEEHPARSNAAGGLARSFRATRCVCVHLQSSIIAMAIKIMSTWW